MKLALIIDANPRSFRALGHRNRLRDGNWTIVHEGVVNSEIAIYHALLDRDNKLIGEGFDKYILTDEPLILKGPAHCYVEFLKPGNEKSVSIFAQS